MAYLSLFLFVIFSYNVCMKLQKIFVVLGPPGSGKGTQSELLAKFLGAPRIVLGDLIREFIQENSDEAHEAKARYDQGTPQPDAIASMLLDRKLKALADSGTVVFDTYPLSMGQAEDLDRIVEDIKIKDLRIVFLNVSEEEVVKRITIRGQGRSDDDPQIARHRYEEYEKRNILIKEHYKSKGELVEINGDQPIEDVHREIMQKLVISNQ
ncbi:MAG: hypothetical protein A2720_02865 [Candidatus Doudnabacteria bacterium RIFCSPHIGHO2_01_FULL_46_24]|uniref:Adenylate kinase n=1 Tax=Candidatus Doudnabacteria bacterium RIFCSPHIGHO2_01_FULL_46_24 TaxID=1817825 RepID=A0A1F5NUX0_9BACT|nr:MAG: hypothetical protein A2720_02865 [Candidatus Doudnabacteria bacterium RIFCSPHIGHO2_01_FULL_46_24]